MTHPWWFRGPEEGPESPKSSVRRFRPTQSSRSERLQTGGCASGREAGTLGESQADEAKDASDGDGRAFRWRCCCGDDRFHRIREAPSLRATEVGLLQNGEEFDVIEQSLGWVQHARGWSVIHVDGKQVATMTADHDGDDSDSHHPGWTAEPERTLNPCPPANG